MICFVLLSRLKVSPCLSIPAQLRLYLWIPKEAGPAKRPDLSIPTQGTSFQSTNTAQDGSNVISPTISGSHIRDINYYISVGSKGGDDEDTFPNSEDIHVEDRHQKLKDYLKINSKISTIQEGLAQHGNSKLLNDIYTAVYITEGESGEVNNEHEVRPFEKTALQETPILSNDIFRSIVGKDKPIRTVLTKGIAGIGKSVSLQKFVLDWVEGKANQDIKFIFPLLFRDLNLMRENKSLMDILHPFLQTKEAGILNNNEHKVLFIFDGLDECRLPLDFQNNKILSDITESTSLHVLLTNLIKGNLLPSARIWITSQSAAANRIPPEFVDRVTEVRGFNDPQKEEFFRRRFSDQKLANRIIKHIKSIRSLYIMCHIPLFCWILATVLERMNKMESGEIPKTLTQMFTHFLNIQRMLRKRKYPGEDERDPLWYKASIMSLGKLAYQQLEKDHRTFFEEDLTECGIDVREGSIFSRVCSEMFNTEFGLYESKTYQFVHLSIQEFLAAVYVFISFKTSNENPMLEEQHCSKGKDIYLSAVDKAVQSENGHLDLFLRFLLGLSLKSNQDILQGVLIEKTGSSQTNEKTAMYIKMKIKEKPSPECCINLFHCLNELNDHSLQEEIQSYIRSGSSLFARLSSAQWSALVFVLLTSTDELEVFDLKKYIRSDECLLRLLPVVKASRTALLNGCKLTWRCCEALASALSSKFSSLRQLDLGNNDLQDSGVKTLCAGLGNPLNKLDTLKLSQCNITEEGCASLALALRLNPSHPRELNLSGNNLGDSGVKMLSTVLKDPQCKLQKLRMSGCGVSEEGCSSLASALTSNPSHLRELDLSRNDPGGSGVEKLSAVLVDTHCKLETLRLSNCSITEEGCASLASAVTSNPSHLRELDLSGNNLGDSELEQLTVVLKNPQCKLEKLLLKKCTFTVEGCAALAMALALRPRPSPLRELDLSENQPGNLGVKLLSSVLEDKRCTLETLRLNDCNLTEKCCEALASALSSSTSSLRELDLGNNKLHDVGVKLFSVGLGNTYCNLATLRLSDCGVTANGIFFLSSALKTNPSFLRELDMSRNSLGDSGVNLLSAVLENLHCNLETLHLKDCNLTARCCGALASALSSKGCSLRELDLSGNELKNSGVELLCVGLGSPHCKVKTLRMSRCRVTDGGCSSLASALLSNPSHLREINLDNNNPGYSGLRLLSAVMEDPTFKLETLSAWPYPVGREK
ncbi:NACHT, LRR and PYD domains-containing protein 3-like isoform X2 [Oncorhynchus nerka]|uniref:NACHT, LRR and PYD domains-containing protein 3-like isoform X2 n=1 Tax=Oncorhynchus nerka TaxID=8023 RepID=UPI0011314296|nr:NACHT, LRR and PYD domains-containing protein 3-like isoform X1 [Oncorhynchus nerka]